MKKRAKSSGSDSDWKELADKVKKYTSMLSDDCSDCSSEDGIDDDTTTSVETMTQSTWT
jgi:hypothetical protein